MSLVRPKNHLQLQKIPASGRRIAGSQISRPGLPAAFQRTQRAGHIEVARLFIPHTSRLSYSRARAPPLPLTTKRQEVFSPRRCDMKRVLLLTIVSAAALALSTSSSEGMCEAIQPSIECSDAPCFMLGRTAWDLQWTDQSNCGCDRIEIYADEDCDGSYDPVTELDCSATSFTFCGYSYSSYRLKVVYMLSDKQTVNDIVSSCVQCPD